MPTRRLLPRLLVLALIGAGAILFAAQFVPALHLREVPIDAARLAHLPESPAAAQAALALVRGGRLEGIESLHVSRRDPGDGVTVTIQCTEEDDSVYRTYHRVQLRWDAHHKWIPLRWQTTQQGRGAIGWTSRPTL